MKQLNYISHGDLQWEEASEPVLSTRTSAIVRPFVVSRSDIDAMLLNNDLQRRLRWSRLLQQLDSRVGERINKDPFKGPFVLGQECIAEIVETGPDLKSFSQGQKVIVPSQVSCGSCVRCKAGLTSHCEIYGSNDFYGAFGKGTKRGGFLSDKVLVPDATRMLVPFPDDLDPVVFGSASGNLADAWGKVAPTLLGTSGKRVLVIGGSARSTALYAVAFAASMQPGELDYVDLSSERVAIAGQLGANGIEAPFQKQRGQYDLVVCGNSDKRAMRHAIERLAPGGICSAIHMPLARLASVPLFRLYSQNLTVSSGLPNIMAELPSMLEYLRTHNIALSGVNTHVADFDSADQHFLKKTTKVIVHRDKIY